MNIRELQEKILAEELLFSLIQKGDIENFKTLIEKVVPKPNLNVKHEDGYAPLMLAADEGNAEIVKVLIEAKADVTLKANGKTALDIAKNDECIELLTTPFSKKTKKSNQLLFKSRKNKHQLHDSKMSNEKASRNRSS